MFKIKKLDLAADIDVVRDTFLDDYVGRNADVAWFYSFLNAIEGGFAIALNGDWGSGKTFFIKHEKLLIDSLNGTDLYEEIEILNNAVECSDDKAINNHPMQQESLKELKAGLGLGYLEDQEALNALREMKDKTQKLSKNLIAKIPNISTHIPQKTIYYDAWMNDKDEDPVGSLVYSILRQYPTAGLSRTREFSDQIKGLVDAVQNFGGSSLSKGLGVFKTFLDTNSPMDTTEICKDKSRKIHDFFTKILSGDVDKNRRLIIFVDELDRCNPEYAVKLLESIKHYFDHKDITFVFSVNLEQLQYTIKRYYGAGFDAYRYLNRFFDQTFTIPLIDKRNYYDHVIKVYKNNSGRQNIESAAERAVSLVMIERYDFSMREISKYISNLKTINGRKTIMSWGEENAKEYEFCSHIIIPLALGIYVHSITDYKEFINGKQEELFVNLMDDERIRDFAMQYLINSSERNGVKEYKNRELYKERLKEFYRVICEFSGEFHMLVGEMSVGSQQKKELIDTLNGLSKYSYFYGNQVAGDENG